MKRYIDADKLIETLNAALSADTWAKGISGRGGWSHAVHLKDNIVECINKQPTADVVEVKRKNPDDENCVICNSELDEAGTGGIWDLAAEICDEIYGELNYMDEQDTIYNIIREYIEQQEYCPRCGAKTEGAIHNENNSSNSTVPGSDCILCDTYHIGTAQK